MLEKQLRVLHVLSGDVWGGREAQVYEQLSEAKRQNRAADFAVLFFNEQPVAPRFTDLGVQILQASELQGLAKLLSRAYIEAEKFKPQIVLAHGYKESLIAFLIAKKNKSKLISVFHGKPEPATSYSRLKTSLAEKLSLFIARYLAGAVVGVSQELCRYLQQRGVPPKKIVHIPNCLPQLSLSKSEASEKVGSSLIQAAVVMIGRLNKVKRYDLAIRAFSLLPQGLKAHLYIVGEGPERAQLEQLIESLSLRERVSLLGFKQRPEQFLSQAKLFLLSSESEGMPTVLLEAISERVPIVASAVGGVEEVLSKFPDYPQRLLKELREQSLAQAITECLTAQYSSGQAEGENWEEQLKLFSAEVVFEQYLSLYSALGQS